MHRAVVQLASFHADIADDSPRLRYALECWRGLNRTRRWLRGEVTRDSTQELLASTLNTSSQCWQTTKPAHVSLRQLALTQDP